MRVQEVEKTVLFVYFLRIRSQMSFSYVIYN